MRDSFSQQALLMNLGGAHLPPVVLTVSAHFQSCVNAGSAAALGFFDELAIVGLHDHIACSLEAFTASVRAGMASTGECSPDQMQEYVDAFAAGYLGRVHQELRLFHGEDGAHARPSADVRVQASNLH